VNKKLDDQHHAAYKNFFIDHIKIFTNNILNLFFIKNLYINSLIDTINIVAYKKYIDSINRFNESYITKFLSTIFICNAIKFM